MTTSTYSTLIPQPFFQPPFKLIFKSILFSLFSSTIISLYSPKQVHIDSKSHRIEDAGMLSRTDYARTLSRFKRDSDKGLPSVLLFRRNLLAVRVPSLSRRGTPFICRPHYLFLLNSRSSEQRSCRQQFKFQLRTDSSSHFQDIKEPFVVSER